MPRTVKVAVIGSGLAGLTAAYRIAKAERLGDVEFEVHLFEKVRHEKLLNFFVPNADCFLWQGVFGGHGRPLGLGRHSWVRRRVQSRCANAFISRRYVFRRLRIHQWHPHSSRALNAHCTGYYPQLISLYAHLGVHFRQADFTYSFSTVPADACTDNGQNPQRSIRTTMIYNGQSGSKGVGMPTSLYPPTAAKGSSPSIAAWAKAYVGFMIATLFVIVFYLRLVMFSLPLRLDTPRTTRKTRSRTQQLKLQLSSVFYNTFSLIIPCRPRLDLTLREWTVQTTPSSPIARVLTLDTRWQEFIQDVIVPLFSAVCTCGEEMVWELPIEEVLGSYRTPDVVCSLLFDFILHTDYVYLTFRTHHYVVSNGVRDVAKRLSASIDPTGGRIHLGMPIVSLVYSYLTSSDPEPTIDVHCVGGKVFSGFSHVIMATQANHASKLLQSYLDTVPRKLERHRTLVSKMVGALKDISYCRSIVINHTDGTLMPEDDRDRRDLNLITSVSRGLQSSPDDQKVAEKPDDSEDLCVPSTYTMATHILPTPAPSPDSTPKSEAGDTPIRIYQTTNPIVPPREDSILSVARLERAVVTVKGKRAVRGFWRSGNDCGYEAEEEEGANVDSGEDSPLAEEGKWSVRWGCSATEKGALGPLQGAGRLDNARALRSRRSMPSLRNVQRNQAMHKEPGIWVCGSYAHSGIPLLEGCVVSARNVVEQGIWVAEGVEEEGAQVRALW